MALNVNMRAVPSKSAKSGALATTKVETDFSTLTAQNEGPTNVALLPSSQALPCNLVAGESYSMDMSLD